jgi:hypothetical protein
LIDQAFAALAHGDMREIFQRHLRPLGGKAYRVSECQISYVRHRESGRRMLHYTLRLVELDTGREHSQLVTGTTYRGGQTRRTWEKLQRKELGRALPGTSPNFEPFSYIPDLDVLVQVFPYDHRLPALRLLMVGPPPGAEEMLLARFGPGDWHTEAWDVKTVRYRVGMRATLRLTVRARDAATGRAEERRFYARVYPKEEEGAEAYRVLRMLGDKASTGSLVFTVARPIAYLSDLRILLQEKVPGVRLLVILRQGEEEAIPAVRKAARAAAALHLLDVDSAQQHSLREKATNLEEAGDLLRSARPALSQRIKEVIGAIVGSLEEVPPAPTHGDLKPGHIYIDGNHITLLDFDNFAGADPILDIANFLASLTLSPLRSGLPLDPSRRIGQVFVEEYFSHAPQNWRKRLPLHYAGTMLRKAAGSSRRQEPGWPNKVEVLLKEAEDSLAGRVW